MMLRSSSTGNTPMNIAGMMAKYLATSLAIENVVSAPRVMSSCLPISTISMSFVGSESRSTMLPASLAACVPVFIATPTSAWASAGASLVPSPVMAMSRPPACSRLISAILSSGVASARKSSTPASAGDGPRGERVVAGDHDRADAHGAQLVEALAHAVLDDVLELDDAEDPARADRTVELGHGERRAAVGGDAVGDRVDRLGHRAAALEHPPLAPRRPRPCGCCAPSRSTPLMRVCAVNGTSSASDSSGRRAGRSCSSASVDDRTALGRLVGQARQVRGGGQLVLERRRAAG